MPDRAPVEHWWCPACGTFDGPHDEGFCDVCADGTCIDGLVPQADVERLQRVVDGVRSKTALDVVAEKMAAEDRARKAETEVERLRANRDADVAWANKMLLERDEALAEVERLRKALREIKRVCAIEAPPVSDDAHAKAWKIAYDAIADSPPSDITAQLSDGEQRS